MLDRTIVAFDIETMPDPDIGRRVMQLEGDDDAVVAAMVQRRLDEGQSRYPALPWHKVVCVCVAALEPTTGAFELRALGAQGDERSTVAAFYSLFDGVKTPPRLVSWNGGGFDLPVLRYRALKYGIAAPGFHALSDPDRGSPAYLSRYRDLHIDVMDVLSGYGASARAGLGAVCHLLGLPAKGLLDREVYEHVLAGETERVVDYCKLDALQTLLVFLAWLIHTGTLERDGLAAHVQTIRTALLTERSGTWPPVAQMLETWPSW